MRALLNYFELFYFMKMVFNNEGKVILNFRKKINRLIWSTVEILLHITYMIALSVHFTWQYTEL